MSSGYRTQGYREHSAGVAKAASYGHRAFLGLSFISLWGLIACSMPHHGKFKHTKMSDAHKIELGSGPGDVLPLLEYVFVNNAQRDVIYASPQDAKLGSFAKSHFSPSQLLGLAYKLDAQQANLLPLYRCLGTKFNDNSGWLYTFYSTDSACAGHPFDKLAADKTTAVAQIMAPDAPLPARQNLIPLYRYWVDDKDDGAISVLSTQAPDVTTLAILRYLPTESEQANLMGYIIPADKTLDGNQRWVMGLPQNFCYGIEHYQTQCPEKTGAAPLWRLRDPATNEVLLEQAATSLGQGRFTAESISGLVSSGKIAAHHPLLVEVSTDDGLLAAKLVRIIRVPWLAQYDNALELDDDQSPGGFPTQASAVLMANQLTAHTSLDPLAARNIDPALYDGIITKKYFDANFDNDEGPLATIGKKQAHGFQAMDAAGILVGAEVPYSMHGSLNRVYPFDVQRQLPATDPSIALLQAETFDKASGRFVRATDSYVQSGFQPDFSNPATVGWLLSGVQSYLKRLYGLGIHLAYLTFSEVSLQGTPAWLSQNLTRQKYYLSPTFSESAYRSFKDWLRENGADPQFYALPALPADYAKAASVQNPQLYRIQSVAADSPLWTYWSKWRLNTFNGAIAKVARELKKVQAAQAYARSPLQIVVYNYPDWTSIDGVKFDSSDLLAGLDRYWPQSFKYDTWPTSPTTNPPLSPETTIFVGPGADFYQVAAADPGAVDYVVYEVKFLADAVATSEAQRMVKLRDRFHSEGIPTKIGLHVEVETPLPGSNYMNQNLDQVFSAGYRTPTFDMVWSWEAQCEYMLSMKKPDEGLEHLSVSVANDHYTLNDAGSYAALLKRYPRLIGNYCLYRHLTYNLAQDDVKGTQAIPMSVLQDNVMRLLKRRLAYLSSQ